MLFVEKELFVIPNGENFVLYSPTTRTVLNVTGGVVKDLQICEKTGEYPEGKVCDTLLKAGILEKNIQYLIKPDVGQKSYLPTSVTLFPTSDCGMRCIYCYASAGVTPKLMDFSVAKAAINLIIENAVLLKKETASISFHGGGEPLYGVSGTLVRKIVEYAKNLAKEKRLKVSFSCATNGVLSSHLLAWAIENIDRLNLSLDGPPDIQDVQRPLKTGSKSSPFVERTLKFLEKNKVNYGVRATITKLSVGRLTEVVDYIHNVAPSARMHIEPLFSCGRCTTTGAEAPDSSAFIEAFISANAHAKKLGKSLYHSGSSVDKYSEYFCGASRGSFCVTPWGDVTSCYEVSLPSDERSEFFFFGSYDFNKNTFEFNKEKLAKLSERCVSNIMACNDCFMKYACAGDCPAKSMTMTGSPIGGFRCDENRTLGAIEIIEHSVSISK